MEFYKFDFERTPTEVDLVIVHLTKELLIPHATINSWSDLSTNTIPYFSVTESGQQPCLTVIFYRTGRSKKSYGVCAAHLGSVYSPLDFPINTQNL
jgi:hypothetical protein